MKSGKIKDLHAKKTGRQKLTGHTFLRIRAYLTYKEVKSMLSIVANSSSISASLIKIINWPLCLSQRPSAINITANECVDMCDCI